MLALLCLLLSDSAAPVPPDDKDSYYDPGNGYCWGRGVIMSMENAAVGNLVILNDPSACLVLPMALTCSPVPTFLGPPLSPFW